MKALFAVVLLLSLLAGVLVDTHPHFAVERIFAGYAVYGFAACAALILAAKALGLLLKRVDTYYDD
jgi:hypothetical protein